MAFYCPQSIKACAMALTRLNDCGVPLDPLVPNSRIQFSTFMSLTLSPDLDGGNNIVDKDACGNIVIRDKDCDRLLGFNAKLALVGVPLPVLEMLLDAIMLGGGGDDVKGGVLRESKAAGCAPYKMIELWSKNANRAQCGIGGSGGQVYVRWGLPLTRNWEISGDITYDVNAVAFELTGYVENNPNWFPSWPDSTFPSYVPGGGDPTSVPTGAPPCVLPAGITADSIWGLDDQTDIQAGGPLYWASEAAIPNTVVNCDFAGIQAGS